MSEYGLSDAAFGFSINVPKQTSIERAKTSLEILPNGKIFVDWRDLPKHPKVHQYVVHYRSLNNKRNSSICVSRKKRTAMVEKIEIGHLYEIHVCATDNSNQVLTSTEPAQIQSIGSGEEPLLYVIEATPDFVTLEWTLSKSMKSSDVEFYKIIMNGNTIARLPSTENGFVVNDGELGKRYVFQLELLQKNRKLMKSLPIVIKWPGVRIPKIHAVANGNEQLFISWGNSISINDGSIQSYTVHLYDSEGNLLNKFGPNPPDCQQLWIKDLKQDVYLYALEIKLENSRKSIFSKPIKMECGRESTLPILKYYRTDTDEENKLIDMAQILINIRDNMKSKHLFDKCGTLLNQVLSTLTNLTNAIHLNLSIESKSNDATLKSYNLIIDGQENSIAIPEPVEDFPLTLPRRDKPYELAVSVTPALYGTKSKTVLIEASHHFTFFCRHFNEKSSNRSCSYLRTLSYETQLKRPVHQGVIENPKPMTEIQVYDLKQNEIQSLPLLGQQNRLAIILFYVTECVPSQLHLNFFSNYVALHGSRYHFILINCNPSDIDELKNLTSNLSDVESYTDFTTEDFEYEQKNDARPLYEILSLEGVPLYFILDYSGNVVWRGRLCIPNQLKYNEAMDHILSQACGFPVSAENCDLCNYTTMNETNVDHELKTLESNFQYIQRHRIQQYDTERQSQKNRKSATPVYSMKRNNIRQ